MQRLVVKNVAVASVLALGLTCSVVTLAPSAMAQAMAPAGMVTTNSAATPAQAQQTGAGKFIQDLGDKAIAIIANKTLPADQRDAQYRQLLNDAFDLQTIGHFVMGNAWETAGPTQRTDYMNLFKTIVVKTYGDKLNLYAGEKFIVTAVRPESERDSIVKSNITHADGSPPLEVDWRVRNRDGNLAIIDVVVSGVSQSVTQRSEYAAILQQNNGNVDALLDAMRKQVRDLSGSKAQ